MKQTILLLFFFSIVMTGCGKVNPTAGIEQSSATQPADQTVRNEQLTIPDRPLPVMSGKHKY